jgi:hypothetical protein
MVPGEHADSLTDDGPVPGYDQDGNAVDPSMQRKCSRCGHDTANHYAGGGVEWCANCQAPCDEGRRE